jgi:hypothetical protein
MHRLRAFECAIADSELKLRMLSQLSQGGGEILNGVIGDHQNRVTALSHLAHAGLNRRKDEQIRGYPKKVYTVSDDPRLC